jgi:eukaryotic-like serine/threonine-protein kinase
MEQRSKTSVSGSGFATAAAVALPARVGRFAVSARLGEGGMGVVYAAVDPELHRPVAIKVIRQEVAGDSTVRERFQREARLAASIADPRVCRVYEVGEDADQLFIVMELLDGEPLSSRLARGPLPMAESAALLLDVLQALGVLHARGIVHRDLKPSNIFLTATGARLLDFGLARQVAAEDTLTRANLTATGTILGTPRYMAPEQLLGRDTGPQADLFAAAGIFYEMLSGRPAFDAESLAGIMNRILNHEPPSIGGSPAIEAADRIIQRALSQAPSGRYPSSAAMADDVRALSAYGDDGPAVAEPRAPARSIAVLPFQSIGGDTDAEEFADGMTEDVIARLSRIRSFKVIARRSVMALPQDGRSPREAGARLGVRTVLDGTIRRSGSRVRIVVQLVDARTEAQIWSESYDREMADVFAVQADVAGQIACALETGLSSGEQARVARPDTRNPAAHRLYLKGRHCLMKYTGDGVRLGLRFLEEAVAEDEAFALGHAWIGLGHVIAGMGYDGGDVPAAHSYTRARGAAERALAIDPDLGDAHGALAFVKLVMDFDWSGAERGFRRALELSPGSELVWSEYGLLLSSLERYEEAIAAYRRAIELDPLTPIHASTLASMLLRAGRVGEALDEALRLIEVRPEFPLAHSNLGWARLKQGAVDAGLADLERAVALAPGNTMLLGQLGHAYGTSGRMEPARAILARLEDRAATAYVSPYHLAYVHAGLRQDNAAMDCLEQAYEQRAGGVYGMKGSFLFAGLSSHPRFAVLLERMNLGAAATS